MKLNIMTDKDKFRKEVEKLKSNLIYGACSSQIAMETMCKEEAYNEVLAILDTMQEEPVSNPTPNKKMSVERWKKACEAACCDRNYRSHYGLTETRDDYFVDGVQWADEHPKEEPVSEELEEAASRYAKEEYNSKSPATLPDRCRGCYAPLMYAFKAGSKWQKENLWKPADGDDLKDETNDM